MARWEGKRNECQVGKGVQKVRALAPKPRDFFIPKTYMVEGENVRKYPHIHHGVLHPPNKINKIHLKTDE